MNTSNATLSDSTIAVNTCVVHTQERIRSRMGIDIRNLVLTVNDSTAFNATQLS